MDIGRGNRAGKREVFPNNFQEIIVDLPEGYDLVFYLNGLIFLGPPLEQYL